jgi:polyhydroxybutyrate depolymerase
MRRRLLVLLASAWLLSCAAPAREPARAPDPADQARHSAGCGVEARGSGDFVTHTLHAGGVARTYHLLVPESYTPGRAHALIFRWHGSGGDGLSGGLGIEASSRDQALVVAADGLERTWSAASREQDLALFDRLLAELTARYCIDLARVFSYGFSAGGSFTNELACARGDVLRGAAAIASGPAQSSCRGTTAAWLLHDANDDVVPLALGKEARDHALAQNGCRAGPIEVGEGCSEHRGCTDPVVFCETRGFGHDIRGDLAPARVWQFFRALR